MRILRTIPSMREACRAIRSPRTILGLVPTMGALHEGHLSLIRAARRRCDVVAVTIFVNPTQFGPNEDLDRYPRTFEADCALLEREGVDLVFAPSVEEMYPNGGAGTFVDVPEIGSRLDGASRPGHFRGVATVVSKLFHIIGPEVAFFGQKDAAQVAVLRTMVRDLNFPLEMVVCPTVREPDGLALSSRNRFLTSQQREQALVLSRALVSVQSQVAGEQADAERLRSELRQAIEAAPGVRLDYAEIVHLDTLEDVHDLSAGALVAVAAWLGEVRLIDNLLLPPGSAKERT